MTAPIPTVRVTETYSDTGSKRSWGRVIFTPVAERLTLAQQAILLPLQVVASVQNGSLVADLTPNDSPDLLPIDWVYEVREEFAGKKMEPYFIAITSDMAPEVRLSSLAPLGVAPAAPATFVSTLNGKTGNVSIGKADIGLGNVKNVEQIPKLPGKNLFDPTTATDGLFWNGVGTAPISLGGWSASIMYPVTAGQVYSVNNCRNFSRFDLAGVQIGAGYINNSSEAPLTVTIPAGTGYIAFNVAIAKKNATQLELGTPTSFEAYGVNIPNQLVGGKLLSDVASTVGSLERLPGVSVFRNGSQMLLRTPFDTTRDIIIPMQTGGGSGLMFQMSNAALAFTSLIPSSAPDSTVWPTFAAGTGIHGTGDDNSPLYLNWSYVGANHGYSAGSQVTVPAHGKTNADLGSTWSDGTRTYTLLQIVSSSVLLFANPYTVSSGIATGGTTAPAAPLTHVSGATNTATVPISGGVVGLVQIFPSSYGQTVTIELDGKVLPDGKSSGQLLTVTETYYVAGYKGIVDVAQANVGTPVASIMAQVPPLARVSNTYRFSSGGLIVVAQKVTVLEKTVLAMGVTQAYGINTPPGGSLKQFMAGIGTAGPLDLSTLAPLSAMAGNVDITPATYLNPNVPATTMQQWAYDSAGNPQYGLAMGILPVADGQPSQRIKAAAGKSWFISSAVKKNYPQVVWNKTFNPGESVSGVAFRRYLAPPDSAAEFTVTDGSDTWAIIERVSTTADGRMPAPRLLNRRLDPVVPSSIVAATRVTGEGVAYTAPVVPAYGMWRMASEPARPESLVTSGLAAGQYFVVTQSPAVAMALTGSFQILYLFPQQLQEAMAVDRQAIEVTVLGTGVLRHGIYGHDPMTGGPVLTGPLADFGTVDITSIGIKETSVSTVLPALHWYGIVWQGTNTTAPTLRVNSGGFGASGPMAIGSSTAFFAAARYGYSMTGVTGALGALSSLGMNQLSVPRVAYRKA